MVVTKRLRYFILSDQNKLKAIFDTCHRTILAGSISLDSTTFAKNFNITYTQEILLLKGSPQGNELCSFVFAKIQKKIAKIIVKIQNRNFLFQPLLGPMKQCMLYRTNGVSIFIDYGTALRDTQKGGRRRKRHSTSTRV